MKITLIKLNLVFDFVLLLQEPYDVGYKAGYIFGKVLPILILVGIFLAFYFIIKKVRKKE